MDSPSGFGSEQLLLALKGQKVVIPNLQNIFRKWPQGVNNELENNQLVVDQYLDSLLPEDDKRLAKLKASDFGFFGAAWWPEAPKENLRIVTIFSIWVFIPLGTILKDQLLIGKSYSFGMMIFKELDSEAGILLNDFATSQIFRADTVSYVRHCLGFCSYSYGECKVPQNHIIRSFEMIGNAICKVYNEDQRRNLLNEIELYIEMTEVEQEIRLSGSLPSVQSYWKYRMGTSAVRVSLSTNEYSKEFVAPQSIFLHISMRKLWDKANEIIWISSVNDIMSVKKELSQGSAESLIPLLFIESGSAQMAVTSAIEMLRIAVEEFDECATKLTTTYINDEKASIPLQYFIEACQFNCTGNLNWSLITKRYGIVAATRWWEFYTDVVKDGGGKFAFEVELMHRKYGSIIRASPDELHVKDPE
ncbi:hypothetical protein G7Y89_g8894 [Cudoniella acicularis]|uniref:Terpene synthase n=1 Tax=Cudoniella acicularis TaxID=354080 RepID=A0A8H4RHW4_9HELO|nr:hypothetical protein G7Y89_g8894 [Cudoniella acicularis]